MHIQTANLGDSTLALIADGRTLRIIHELAHGPARPGELEQRLDGLTHAGLMRRLHRLARHGVVSHERFPESPPRVHYTLTQAGYAILGIPALAARWEQSWRLPDEHNGPPGVWALEQIADRRTRKVMIALADGPLRPGELERRLDGLGHSAIMRRLAQLVLTGMLARHPSPEGGRQVRYELTARARRLGLLVMLAARWEWQWARPRNPSTTTHPVGPSDLDGLLRVLAPLAQIPDKVAGICQLHFNPGPCAREPCIDLAARAGSVTSLPQPVVDPPAVHGHASPQMWCEALFAGHPIGIATTGDQELLATVIDGLHAALFA